MEAIELVFIVLTVFTVIALIVCAIKRLKDEEVIDMPCPGKKGKMPKRGGGKKPPKKY